MLPFLLCTSSLNWYNDLVFKNYTMRVGYACINLHLAAEKVKVNRSLGKRLFVEKGITHASSIALANFIDLEKVIDWNIANRLLLYRMSSDMIPWMSEYEITDLPDYEKIKDICTRCAQKITTSGLRLTYHPGPFNVLATNSDIVLSNTIKNSGNMPRSWTSFNFLSLFFQR